MFLWNCFPHIFFKGIKKVSSDDSIIPLTWSQMHKIMPLVQVLIQFLDILITPINFLIFILFLLTDIYFFILTT